MPGEASVIEDAPMMQDREWDGGLFWMVAASGGLHLLFVALVVLAPISFAPRQPPMMSYTVDLIAPDKIGGTNMVEGGKGKVEAPPLVTAPPPAPAAPPAKVEEPMLPEPPPPPVEVAAKPEPQPAPPPPPPAEPQAAPKPEPKPAAPPEEPPKPVEAKPEAKEIVIPDKAKKPEPKPSAAAAKPSPAVAKPSAAAAKPSPVVAAKPEAKPSPPKGASPPAAQAKSAGPPSASGAAKSGAQGKPGASGTSQQLDDRIAAAVKRVEQRMGTHGGGLGSKPADTPGGPIGVGPGQGVGGAVLGVEYLIYLNQLQARLKDNWAWAGPDTLEASVHFGILETGEVVDVRITKPSGDATFDASVERAVRAVNPLPPPPASYRKQFSDVEFTFTPKSLQM
jgi:TonB family protein